MSTTMQISTVFIPNSLKEVISNAGQFLVDIAQKVYQFLLTACQQIWNISCQIASQISPLISKGYLIAKQWTNIGWDLAKEGASYIGEIALKGLSGAGKISLIALSYLKNFLSVYRTPITYIGIGVFATILLLNLWNIYSQSTAEKNKKA